MYHISNAPRTNKSANLIVQSVIELCQIIPLTEITISQIQRHSTVSRATFYRLFDNTVDVLQFVKTRCDLLSFT